MLDAYFPFALSLGDTTRLFEVDEILAEFLGRKRRRSMIAHFGFSSKEIGLVAKSQRERTLKYRKRTAAKSAKDVFVHNSSLERLGLTSLADDQKPTTLKPETTDAKAPSIWLWPDC